MNERIRQIAEELESFLEDEFSREVLKGSLQVFGDETNKVRLNLSATGIRELFYYFLDKNCPDDQVLQCVWFKMPTDRDSPSWKQKAIYAIQGGLPDILLKELGLDHSAIHNNN